MLGISARLMVNEGEEQSALEPVLGVRGMAREHGRLLVKKWGMGRMFRV
jgi:hypothetical protein